MLKSKTDAKCNRPTEGMRAAGSAASTKPNHPSWASSTQMPYVMCKYQPKKGTDNIQPTACELPWLQQKGAWIALRSYACWADVALPDPNHTWSGNPEEPPLVLSQTTDLFKFNCLICPVVWIAVFMTLQASWVAKQADCLSDGLSVPDITSRGTTFIAQDLSSRGPQLGSATMLRTSKILQRIQKAF